jgi:hypothetical protein
MADEEEEEENTLGTPEEIVKARAEAGRLKVQVSRLKKRQTELQAELTSAATKGVEKQIEIETRLLSVQQKVAEAKLDQLEQERAILILAGEEGEALNQLNLKIAKQVGLLDEATENLQNYNKALKAGAGIAGNLASSIGIASSSTSELLESMADPKAVFKGFKAGFIDAFSYSKIAASIMDTIIQESRKLFSSVDKVNSQFRKDFGTQYGERLAKTTMSIEGSLRKYNVTYEQTAESVQSLTAGVSDFTDMSGLQRESLIADSALLAKSGIDNVQYSETIQIMTNSYGESVESARENIREIKALSGAIGKSTKDIMSDFTKVRGFIAQYGSNYEQVFRRMEVVSRKTGAAIEDLVDISKGFDTFEQASTSVGNLNALLGGPFLNTIDMINTEDPAEQIMKIKDAFDAAGKSVNSMSRRELQAFAAQIPGINGDIEKMRMIFGQLDSGILDTADSINAALEGTQNTTAELAEQTKKSMTVEEQFKSLQQNMAVTAESLSVIANVFSTSLGAVNSFGESIKYILSGISVLGATVAKSLGFAVNSIAKIPGISSIFSLFTGLSKIFQGDLKGGFLDLATGALLGGALIFTGGTAAPVLTGLAALTTVGSLGLDVSRGLENRKATTEGREFAEGGVVTREMNNVTIGESGKEIVIPLENGKDYLTEPLAKAVRQVGGSVGGGTPNINLTVMLEGKELRAFVKNVIAENLNPLR